LSSSSTDSDSDYPPASQRENRPSGLGTRLRNPSGSSDLSTAAGADALKQCVQLTTQLAATVQQQLERTQNEAAQREQRIFNDIAEREHRLLLDAADRESRLLSAAAERDRRASELEAQREERLLDDAKHARQIEAQREQILVRDAQSARQELFAEIKLQRDRETQREIDMRRDMYDLAAQRSRAAAFEAELSCLKANIGPPAVAPVQSVDIPPPEIITTVTPTVVQTSSITDALTSYSDAADARSEYGYRGAGWPPSLSSDVTDLTAQYMPPRSFAVTDSVHTHMPMPAFPRTRSPPAPAGTQYTEPQMFDRGYIQHE